MSDRWPARKSARFAILASIVLWAIIALILVMAFEFFDSHAKASPIILPPPEYDHPFTGRMVVENLPIALSTARCAAALIPNSYACAWWFPDNLNPGHEACHLIFPSVEDVVAREDRENRRHENAHCAPPHWPANHPNGHYE